MLAFEEASKFDKGYLNSFIGQGPRGWTLHFPANLTIGFYIFDITYLQKTPIKQTNGDSKNKPFHDT